jgi:NAD(P)-dependent dehydrogenase (short-subunit alcohol dehydrogenase family)
MTRLQDKVAIITGGAGGIGASASRLFAAEGAKVCVVDIDESEGGAVAEVIRSSGGTAFFQHTDVRAEASVREAVAATVQRYGKVDVLFNVAGGSSVEDKPVDQVDMALWDRTMSLDLLGTFLMCRHAVPAMLEAGGGTIVNTSSWCTRTAFHKHVYVSAKGAVESLTRSIAGEYAKRNIRANVVSPGGVRSERNLKRYQNADSAADPREAERQRIVAKYPLFVGDPIDIARVALFLASDESRMVTGAVIPADGGRSIY